jgi:hypothetical protein
MHLCMGPQYVPRGIKAAQISKQHKKSPRLIHMLPQLMYLERDSAGGPSNQPIHGEQLC